MSDYGHAEATARALEAFDLRFLTKDLLSGGRDIWLDPEDAEEIAKDLLAKGWKRR